MKKYILYILTGVAPCGLCSCEDALDRYPKDRLTPDNFFHTEEECQLYTNDFYTMFPSAGTIYGETADIIATYVYRMGLGSGNYSYATAVGLFQGVINLVLLTVANKVSSWLTGSGLW